MTYETELGPEQPGFGPHSVTPKPVTLSSSVILGLYPSLCKGEHWIRWFSSLVLMNRQMSNTARFAGCIYIATRWLQQSNNVQQSSSCIVAGKDTFTKARKTSS